MSSLFTKDQLYVKANNRRLTQGLFHEYSGNLLTLAKEDHPNGAMSLYKLFVALVVDDPTETVFAEAIFGEVTFWNNLNSVTFIRPHLEEWRAVCDVKRKQKAFAAILHEIETKGRSSFTASKYIIEEPWKTKKAEDKRGTRAATRETTRKAFESKEVQEDAKRILN